MAPLQKIVLRNYRRFRGEIELPLSSGIDLVIIPPGMGKSSLAEAVAWCLVGRTAGATPAEVFNIEAREEGEPGALVALSFRNDEEVVLERSLAAVAGAGLKERTAVRRGGTESEGFVRQRETLFPAACIGSNIISGASLERVMQGERTGTERAVAAMPGWSSSDALLRSSMEATSLYLSMASSAAERCLLFDERGRPMVQCPPGEPMEREELYLLVLSSALAFARESCPGVPVILDEPFGGLDEAAAERAAVAVTEFMAGRQLILLLSGGPEIAAVRAAGRADKELEIRG